ncbi:peptide deformylase [Saccharospirillum sp. MSK14-1]|uniref:peptide deformylase n=1 Tax=Saccharospirillum sp. MSK14-1 TaxID=1897632 RepID=UPI000D382548|nr:peptide deformylase [Saccharospirillum sp. MSK14-1]PTY37673.1 peptide deformylase [Saccharospirillum sp. MSK14-1]
MAKLEILEYPDPRLRTKAKPVAEVEERHRTLAADMLETMYDAPGIGLAASQVNVHERIIVVDVSEDQSDPHILINPEYDKLGEPVETQEGCLSVPGYYERVTRSDKIRCRALNEMGEAIEFEAEDLFAICIQHEIDHLDGKLFVDYLSNLKRTRIRKKLEKQHKLTVS